MQIMILYLEIDFILDQKEYLEKLEGELRKEKDEGQRHIIQEQITYIKEGGEKVARGCKIPPSVQRYWEGGEKPSADEISEELHKRHFSKWDIDKEVIQAVMVIFIAIMTILAIFSFI